MAPQMALPSTVPIEDPPPPDFAAGLPATLSAGDIELLDLEQSPSAQQDSSAGDLVSRSYVAFAASLTHQLQHLWDEMLQPGSRTEATGSAVCRGDVRVDVALMTEFQLLDLGLRCRRRRGRRVVTCALF
jgi:hypothetical protein